MKARRVLHLLLSPKLLLPVLLTGALLAVALKLGNVGSVLARVQALPIWIMALALTAGVVYLALKFLQFYHLLVNLGLHPDWRRLVLAFCVGELAVTLPFGVFAQNWVLSATGKADFGRSSAATVIMILTETLVVLLFLAVVGIPGWPELRPLALVFAVGLLVVVFGMLRFGHVARHIGNRVKHPALRRLLAELIRLIEGLEKLSSLQLLALNLLIAGAYLGALAFAFLVVGHGVGVHHLSFLTAATIYAFSLAVVLLCGGLFSQIGTIEVLGMGAAQAWGIGLTDGLALMLGFRLVWTGVMWLVNLPVVFLLWRSLGHHPEPAAVASVQRLEKAVD